ncbi:MAG: diaminobutyrate--2-oxoglutarate transaminase [Anaerolineaceae bacterium]|nr:diaminobutyrate--2-oxoglutarate transaminase [Anaerolineaceae bacterium]
MQIFEQVESQVRSYIRAFPTVFAKGKGATLYDEQGKAYIDFFAGAGTLNYGHNNEAITTAMIDYLQNDGVVHGLDMGTSAKKKFLQTFSETILAPRNLNYKIQFTGPTGTNCVETALKLARRVKGRSNVVSFTNGFHGLTMGATAVTGNKNYRHESYINRSNVSFMPYDGYLGPDFNTINYLRKALEDNSSGLDIPAAVIVETVQAEGGVNVASFEWLRQLEQVCRDHDILLIIDDIQVGNGRSGDFFSFEAAGISPDMVTVSKSIGGGLPMAILLLKPELDAWKPGEHTGTFRGNNLAFVASTAAIATYWQNDAFSQSVKRKSSILKDELEKTAQEFPSLQANVRGRGLLYGLEIPAAGFAKKVSQRAFEKGLVIELSGARSQVVKFLPPLIIEEDALHKGIEIVNEAIAETVNGNQ